MTYDATTDLTEPEAAELGDTLRHGPARRRRLVASLMGQRGGPARAAALSPERRSEIARAAAAARWARAKS